ncbi:MAG: Lrp/AsnC family transcriptional regulator [Spirochaetes bacterium]|nr:Lrp/AsnC family transcriptional regulator [Spirochaetota bacterium]
MTEFTDREALILNRVQKGIPCVGKPFLEIGNDTGCSEDEVLDTLTHLKEKGVIRNISGIFEGEKLGYYLSLVAFEIPKEKIEEAATIINSHPGVSHNYLRDHRYNIWFTLAEEDKDSFNKTVSILASKSSALDFLILRNEKLLKLGVYLNIESKDNKDNKDNFDNVTTHKEAGLNFDSFDEMSREAVLLLQNDLPIDKNPFKNILESGKVLHDEEQLLSYFSKFIAAGIMRRYAAVLKHRSAGYKTNAMTAWKPNDLSNTDCFKESKSVSHLYFRTIHPGRWEYPLFAMIHAKSDEELKSVIDELSDKSGIKDFLVLSSIKEFKKKRVRYFSEEFNEWKRLNYD